MEKLKLSIKNEESLIVLHSDNTDTAESYISIKYNDKSSLFKLTVKQLSFHKKVYQPGEIQVTLQLTLPSGFNDFIPPENISSIFRNASVSLGTLNESIAEGYYVHEVLPRYFSTGTSIEVTLRIFSLDNKLTLDKYCKAYTAKKLRADILCKDTDDILSKSGIKIAKDDQLVFLGYKRKNANKQTENCELIQPYLVQYNESFYDFLVRTANRCGEFLYFENGSLHLGLPQKTKEKQIQSYQSISYQSILDSVVDTEGFYHNGLSSDVKHSENNFIYNSIVSTDDYIYSYKRDEFTDTFSEWAGDWGNKILTWLNLILNNKAISDIVIQMGGGETWGAYSSSNKTEKTNKEYNSKYIDSVAKEQKNADENADEASPFSSVIREEDKKYNFKENLNTLFYNLVKMAENEVSNRAVIVDLGVNYIDVKLGDLVTFAHDSLKKEYVVIEMNGMNYVSDSVSKINYQLVLLPLYTLKWPDDKSVLTLICPPYCPNNKIRNSSPQLAFVADAEDVKGWGRVRIRYPWQQSKDDMSPWIRMTSPFATDGGGVYFRPAKGDEVLIDYENGNIERPYVLGALYTGKVPVPDGERIISSSNGHCIKMKDPEGSNEFFENLWGGLGMLKSIVPPLTNPYFKNQRGLAGGMEITDRYGIYSINMSSSERYISVNSPFGKVDINAFTGITLSAPNGKIVLEAKDIEISAGNTIAVTSGSNIPDALTEMELEDEAVRAKKELGKLERFKLFFKEVYEDAPQYAYMVYGFMSSLIRDKSKGWAQAGGKAVGQSVLGQFIDMTLLRNILEAIIKPSAGTLSIKSWRFMQLEAGRGQARVPNNGYTVSGLKYSISKEHEVLIKEFEAVQELEKIVDTWLEFGLSFYLDAHNARCAFENSLSDYTRPSSDWNKEWTGETVKAKGLEIIKGSFNGTKKKYGEADFYFKDNSGKDIVIKLANELSEAVSEYADYIESPGKKLFSKFARLFSEKENTFDKCMKEAKLSHPFFEKAKDKTETFSIPYITIEKISQIERKLCKRKLIYNYLKNSQVLDGISVDSDEDLVKEDVWISFIESLKMKEEESGGSWNDAYYSFIEGVKEGAMESLSFPDWYKSKDLWGPESEGEILFSDKNGHTISFSDGHLTYVENDNEKAYLDNIRRALMKVN